MKAGDKVICIKKSLWVDQTKDEMIGFVFPRYKQELTIRGTFKRGGLLFLVFEEINNSPLNHLVYSNGEIRFSSIHFRKMDMLDTKAIADEFLEVIEGPLVPVEIEEYA